MPICEDLLVHLVPVAPVREPSENPQAPPESEELQLRRDVVCMQRWIDLNA